MAMETEQAVLFESRARWTREMFDRVVESGAFGEEGVELVRGELVPRSEQGVPHANAIEELTDILVPKLVGRARVRVQLQFVIDDESVLVPDLTIIERRESKDDHPTRAILAIEVSDTRERFDRIVKAPLYAQSGTPEYWLVNVKKRSIEVFTDLRDGEYTKHTVHESGSVRVPGFDDVEVAHELF